MLRDRLVESSRRWAWAALDAYVRGPEDHDFAVHHAGVAAEHLLKAYLASHNPALLGSGKSAREQFHSLVGLIGLPRNSSRTPGKVHTISLGEAFERSLYLLDDSVAVSAQHLDPLADQRNSVAHFGLHDEAKVQEALTVFMDVADHLLSALAIESTAYWGKYESLHDAFFSEEDRSPTRITVAAKISRARNVHAERYETMANIAAKAAREAAVGHILLLPPPDDDTTEIIRDTCPACRSSGFSTCGVDRDSFTFRGETFQSINLLPARFKCYVCELELANPVEIILAGMGRWIHKEISRKASRVAQENATRRTEPQAQDRSRTNEFTEKEAADAIQQYIEATDTVWSMITTQQEMVSKLSLEIAPSLTRRPLGLLSNSFLPTMSPQILQGTPLRWSTSPAASSQKTRMTGLTPWW